MTASSISSLVAYEFGRHAAPGPLVTTNVVAAALSDAGDDRTARSSDELLSGAAIASWCFGEPPPNDRLGRRSRWTSASTVTTSC